MTVPPEAIEAAKQAVKDELDDYPDARQTSWNIAAAALEAAAPLIAAAERERCARLAIMTAENFADDPCMAALRKFADYLRELA